MKTLLIVEDDEIYAASLIRALSRKGYVCSICSQKKSTFDLCRSTHPNYLLLDLNLGNERTQDWIAPIRRLVPAASIVVLTGYGTIPSAVAAIKDGADGYLCKPATPEAIDKALSDGISKTQSPLWELENEHIRKTLIQSGGNITHAAQKLGLHRRTLQRRLKKI